MRKTLGVIEKLTLSPDQLQSDDLSLLRAEGLTDQAIADAIYVCVGFNIINRVADALGVRVPPPEVFVRGAKFLLIVGYKTLSGLQIGGTGSRHRSRVKVAEVCSENNAVEDTYGSMLRKLKEAVFCGPGVLDSSVRKAAGRAAGLPGALDPYVKKVAQHAYKVTDEDIVALRQAGYSEDQIFEVTVSAALGAGLVRLEAGLNALRGKQ